MPITPHQVDDIYAKWNDSHIEVLKLVKRSLNLELHEALFTGCPNFSSPEVKNGGMY